MDKERIEDAIDSTLRAFEACQDVGGKWVDYLLPVGKSDAWVTALVGFACADVARLGPSRFASRAGALAGRAATWLVSSRTYAAGWGFNGITGPDSDSTAWVLRLLASLGLPRHERDVAFLREHWLETGGFATYRRADAWGMAHADVTPNVALALPDPERDPLRAGILTRLLASCDEDGTWPAYWWRTSHYATALSTELLRTWNEAGPGRLCVVERETHALHSAFDVACALLTACNVQSDQAVQGVLLDSLLGCRSGQGRWDGADDLRVTDPSCFEPWHEARGRRYVDVHGLVTSATAIRALACCLRSHT